MIDLEDWKIKDQIINRFCAIHHILWISLLIHSVCIESFSLGIHAFLVGFSFPLYFWAILPKENKTQQTLDEAIKSAQEMIEEINKKIHSVVYDYVDNSK